MPHMVLKFGDLWVFCVVYQVIVLTWTTQGVPNGWERVPLSNPSGLQNHPLDCVGRWLFHISLKNNGTKNLHMLFFSSHLNRLQPQLVTIGATCWFHRIRLSMTSWVLTHCGYRLQTWMIQTVAKVLVRESPKWSPQMVVIVRESPKNGRKIQVKDLIIHIAYRSVVSFSWIFDSVLNGFKFHPLVTCKDVFVSEGFLQRIEHPIWETFEGSSRYPTEFGLVDKGCYYNAALASLLKNHF